MTQLDTLLETTWPERQRAIRGRELNVALAVTGAFAGIAIVLLVAGSASSHWHPVAAPVLVAYVLAARIEFPIGSAYFTPTQLFLVPLFVVAPAPAVPLLVFSAFAGAAAVAAASGAEPRDRVAFSAGDAFHSLGPAIVFTVFADGDATSAGILIVAIAFAAQFVFDLVASALHEIVSLEVDLRAHAGMLMQIWGVDLALGTVGLLAAVVAAESPWAALAPVPIAFLLHDLAAERTRRVDAAQERLIALEQERGRRQAAAALVERQNQFLQDVSHELRTPVTIARGHLENLTRAGLIGAHAEVPMDELDRIERIVERLLVLARADDPTLALTEEVDAEALLEDRFMRWADTHRRAWQLGELAPGTVTADCDSLVAALDALLENAVKHTSETEGIKLSSRAAATGLVVEVADRGTGIPSNALEVIFDRFARVDSARNRKLGGHGLGLPLVRAVARAHRGECTVRSTPEGTVFSLTIGTFRSAG